MKTTLTDTVSAAALSGAAAAPKSRARSRRKPGAAPAAGSAPARRTIHAADLFCGGGGFSTALLQAIEELGHELKLVAVNHWNIAIETHLANHPGVTHLCQSVDTVNPREVVPGGRLDLLLASPECFPAGTLILTRRGLVPIQDVEVGDMVLTHIGRWRPVTTLMVSRQRTVIVRGQGHYGLETTAAHPLHTRSRGRKWNNAQRSYDLDLGSPDWTYAEDAAGQYWASPSQIPPVVVPGLPGDSPEFWWVVGYWLGNGSLDDREGRGGSLSLACAHERAEEILTRAAAGLPGLDWQSRPTRTATLVEARDWDLVRWLRQHFGKLATGKSLPTWALTLSEDRRRALLAGYLAADGSEETRIQDCCSVSKPLALGIKLLAQTLGFHPSFYRVAQHCREIEGRTVDVQEHVYRVKWTREREHEGCREIDGLLWAPVKEVAPGAEAVDVYNLSVEEDESYVADGIVVHNCTHFATARGAKPMNDQSRSCPWMILRWLSALNVKALLIENVKEFQTWGPLHECECGSDTPDDPDPKKHQKGYRCHRPIEAQKGRWFRNFIRNLRELGYKVEWKVLNSADFGDATTRERFFLQARKDKRPIQWPEPSHQDPRKLAAELNLPPQTQMFRPQSRQPWRPAAEIIRWDVPGHSIYMSRAEARQRKLNIVRPLAENTMKRILFGLEKFACVPFLVPQFGERDGQDPRSHPVTEPLPTVTSHGAGALVQPFLLPNEGYYRGNAARGVGEPAPTITSRGGGALIEPYLVVLRNHGDAQELGEPLPSPCASGQHFGLAQPYVVGAGGPEGQARQARGADEPLKTVMCENHQALVQPYLLPHQHGWDAADNVRGADRPLPTVTGTSCDMFLAQPMLLGQQSGAVARPVSEPAPTIAGAGAIGLLNPYLASLEHMGEKPEGRCYGTDQPTPTLTAKSDLALVQPWVQGITQAGGNGKRARSTGQPLATVVTKKEQALVQPYLTLFHGGADGERRVRSVEEPLHSQDTSNRAWVVEPFVVPQFGESRPRSTGEPLGTITTTSRGMGLAEPYIAAFYTGGGQHSPCDAPLPTVTGKARFGLVHPVYRELVPEGAIVGYLDILFRMLMAEELAAAMSFPKTYVFLGNQEERVKLIGNAVAVRKAKALCLSVLSA